MRKTVKIALIGLTTMAFVTACSAGATIEEPSSSQTATDIDPATNPDGGDGGQQLGVVTFGTGLNQQTLHVRSERSKLKVGQKVAWSAALSEPVGATTVQIVIAQKKGGGQTVAYQEEIDVASPDYDTLANEVRLGAIVGVGRFVMRYVNTDGEVLAEGDFQLVR